MRPRPIDLAGFESKFAADADPWSTYTARNEAIKRERIVRALGGRPMARILELGSGNGSNSRVLARRALRLDACEGTARGTELTRAALAGHRGARAHWRTLPGTLPGRDYRAVVIAELLYYLSVRDMRRLARDVNAVLSRHGRIVLAHHRVEFADRAQRAAGIHARFLEATGGRWRRRYNARSRYWTVEAYTRDDARP